MVHAVLLKVVFYRICFSLEPCKHVSPDFKSWRLRRICEKSLLLNLVLFWHRKRAIVCHHLTKNTYVDSNKLNALTDSVQWLLLLLNLPYWRKNRNMILFKKCSTLYIIFIQHKNLCEQICFKTWVCTSNDVLSYNYKRSKFAAILADKHMLRCFCFE